MSKVLGYSREELLRLTFDDVTRPNDRDRSNQAFRGLFHGGTESYQIGKRFIHKNGLVIWGLLTVSAIRDTEGSPVYALGQFQAITKRKRAEQALRISNHHLSVLNSLLEISLAKLPIKEQLERALDEVLAIPWLPLKSKGGIFLADQQSRSLIMTVQKNLPASIQTMCARVPYGECLCGQAAATRCTVHATQHDERYRV